MHLAAGEIEVDVVVGEHARELLDDPAHLEDGGPAHQPGDSMVPERRGEMTRGGLAARPLSRHAVSST